MKRLSVLGLCVFLLLAAVATPARTDEPSRTKATGVINKELGANSSNWDTAPFNMFTFTQTEKIFPTLIISRGDGPVSLLRYAPKQIDVSKLIVFRSRNWSDDDDRSAP